jgi:16S rRNA G966 N2-methylase RsmD
MLSTYKNKKIIKNKLFPFNGDFELWSKLLIDDETMTYISTPFDADKISNIIEQHCIDIGLVAKNLSITDATAGAGGNVISFAKKFKKICAIECDVNRYNFLINNIAAYKFDNVLCYCDDATKLLYDLTNQDIFFFDPPWGGKEYKNKVAIRLCLSEIPIEDICINIFNNIKSLSFPHIIALKLPHNYDFKYLYRKISDDVKDSNIVLYTLNKISIVIISRKKTMTDNPIIS